MAADDNLTNACALSLLPGETANLNPKGSCILREAALKPRSRKGASVRAVLLALGGAPWSSRVRRSFLFGSTPMRTVLSVCLLLLLGCGSHAKIEKPPVADSIKKEEPHRVEITETPPQVDNSKNVPIEEQSRATKKKMNDANEAARLEKEGLFKDGVHFGMLFENDQKWCLEIQAKHERIEKQLAAQKRDPSVKIERYTPEEMEAGIATGGIEAETIRLQLERDGLQPILVQDAVARFKSGEVSRRELAEKKLHEPVVTRSMEMWRQNRRTELLKLVTEVDKATASLRRSMISDDSDASSHHRQIIASNQKLIQELTTRPVKEFDGEKFAVGQIGYFHGRQLEVGDVVNKELGIIVGCITRMPTAIFSTNERTDSPPFFQISGIAKENLKFRFLQMKDEETFVVVGKTLHSFGGPAKEIFDLRSCKVESPFTADDIRIVESSIESANNIRLTKEEQSQLDEARKSAAVIARDKESTTKSKRAASFVESGKVLMKNDKTSGARKQFEKAIAESPDSSAAKEAQKLIDGLPPQ